MNNNINNFIGFCDKMIISNESLILTDVTPKWVRDRNLKNNTTNHTYLINTKSIYNSSVEIESSNELNVDDINVEKELRMH